MSTPNITIINADVLDWCAEYDGAKFHAILCDPSYAMSKKKRLNMDAPVDAEIETVGDVIAAYHSLQQWGDVGFMNREWDNDTAFNPETWRALAKHLHPGGFVMAFASSRGDHRLAVAMEDAGLVIHPKIFLWLNAQSFPKATRPFKKPKKWREVQHRWLGWMGKLGNWILRKWDCPPKYYLDFIFGSYRYGRQALKNCAEPIIVAQKPYSGKPVDSIVETGAGALNIDGGRVGTAADHPGVHKSYSNELHAGWRRPWRDNRPPEYAPTPQGRWPPNFVLSHTPSHKICLSCGAVHPIQPVIEVCPDCGGELEHVEGCKRVGVKRVKGSLIEKPCNYGGEAGMFGNDGNRPVRGIGDSDGRETVADWDCRESCPARKLGEQSGERKGFRGFEPGAQRKVSKGKGGYHDNFPDDLISVGHKDKGTAARFFPQADWEHEEMECSPECPVARLDEQAGERKSGYSPPGAERKNTKGGGGYHGNMPDTYTLDGTYGDSGGASRFYVNANWTHEVAEQLAQADPVRYCPKSPKKERNSGLDDFYWQRDKASSTGFVRVSKEEWEALPKRQRARGNIHSTVKPINLLVWLCKLLSPPEEYAPRRLLIPFSGSGSEVCAAIVSDCWETVVGVEMLQDYVDISEARAAFWSASPPCSDAVAESVA